MLLILNIGCGDDRYGDVRVDIYHGAANILANIECNLPFKDNSFDEVYVRFLLEHARNTALFLNDITRVCKVGGRIIIVTDNASYTWHYLSLGSLRGAHFGGYKSRGPADRHYSIFTMEHLTNHFQAMEIELISMHYIGEPLTIIGRLVSTIIRRMSWTRQYAYPFLYIEARKPQVTL